jgi:multicomponent K+:H+ antiporter subunit E
MRRVLPSPVLSAFLFVLWLLLAQSASAASLLFGAILAVGTPVLTASLRPAEVRMRRPAVAVRLAGRVVADALHSNIAVGAAILRGRELRSGFVRIPLDLRDPNALAVLAVIITATPGTAWAELASDRSALLLHVLAYGDEAEVITKIKARYERPLMEIFE